MQNKEHVLCTTAEFIKHIVLACKKTNFIQCSNVWVLKQVYYAPQKCISLMKNTVTTPILWNITN